MIFYSLLVVFLLSGMAVDLFSPSLPAISSSLNIPISMTKGMIYIYLIGYAIGNLIMGFITDAFGRKNIIRLFMIFLIITSILPAIFENSIILFSSRFFQGISMGCIAVLARSIISDILSQEELIKTGPLIGAAWALGPVLGPIIGGYLQYYLSWNSNFYFFTLTTVLITIPIYIILPETISYYSPFSIKVIKNNISEIVTNTEFMSLVIAMGLVYSLLITFNTLGPFLIQNVLGYSSVEFGQISLIIGIFFLLSFLLCRVLLNYYHSYTIYFLISHISICVICCILIISIFNQQSLFLLIICTAVTYFLCGFIFPIGMGKGLSMFKNISGTASSIMYFINVMITVAISYIESFIHSISICPILIIYSILSLQVVIIYWKSLSTKKSLRTIIIN